MQENFIKAVDALISNLDQIDPSAMVLDTADNVTFYLRIVDRLLVDHPGEAYLTREG